MDPSPPGGRGVPSGGPLTGACRRLDPRPRWTAESADLLPALDTRISTGVAPCPSRHQNSAQIRPQSARVKEGFARGKERGENKAELLLAKQALLANQFVKLHPVNKQLSHLVLGPRSSCLKYGLTAHSTAACAQPSSFPESPA